MDRINKYVVPLLSGVILLCLTSYASTLTNRKGDKLASFSPLTPNQPTQPNTQTQVASRLLNAANSMQTALNPSPTPTLISQKTVTIYRPDSQCQTLVPEKVALPSVSTLQAAVGKVLEQRNSTDFNVAGYRVSVNPKSSVATVDMRIAPTSLRKFVSLSTCEQLALFGSLRKTLTSNQGFKIKNVRFTEQGQEIFL